MIVSEIMHEDLITAHINDTVMGVAWLMRNEDIKAIPILEDDRVVGFVTDRDISLSRVTGGLTKDKPISHFMNEDIISVKAEDDVDELILLMKKNRVSIVLVVDDNDKPLGTVSLSTLVKT